MTRRLQAMAHTLAEARDVLYLGRGAAYPVALEGALKLKEISYIHAEGYPAGEMKHGPIALIDEKVPVIFVAPSDGAFDKTASNAQEVAARGGKVILLADAAGLAKLKIARRRRPRDAQNPPLRRPHPLRRPRPAPRLPHRHPQRHRRRPTQKPRQIRHRGIGRPAFA